MFDLMIVCEALNNSKSPDVPEDDLDSLISLLIHDIFGGEILKTRKRRGWHFYNRVDGLRIDFTKPEIGKSSGKMRFEDIPSTPDETYAYVEQERYSTFLIRFVRAFEEVVGLEKYQPGYTS
jgi:hypothetical protein